MLQLSMLLTLIFLLNTNVVNSVFVTIEQGILEGSELRTDDGFSYEVFYNIPYAAPPLGELRFKEPELPPSGWDGIRDATKPGEACFQILHTEALQYKGVEDCLQLNIFAPSEKKNKTLPVMYWIHGGGFDTGSAPTYDPKLLVEKYVILVTANYRVGILGFLSLDIPDVPGNAGLKDMLKVLEWIQRNIQNFGGNPDNVTIFGNSAGSASVHYLVMSPLAKGIFNKAIMQSGVSINDWPVQTSPENVAKQLLKIVRVDNILELVEILEILPIKLIALIAKQVPYMAGRISPFRPVIEKKYSKNPIITEDPNVILESGKFNKVSTLNGFVSEEGILFLNPYANENSTLEQLIPDFIIYVPKSIRQSSTPEEIEIVKEKIKNFYFPDRLNIIEKYIDLNSDSQFIRGIQKSTIIFSKYEPNTFYYEFSYNGVWNMNKYSSKYEYKGAAHGDENGYLFDMSHNVPAGITPTKQDYLTRRRMVELWTNFAKFGNPTPRVSENVDVMWKPVNEDDLNCLIIDANINLVQDPLKERMEFWRKLEDRSI